LAGKKKGEEGREGLCRGVTVWAVWRKKRREKRKVGRGWAKEEEGREIRRGD
jgi:hypothetical protein